MKIHFYKIANFGDDLNRWLWARVLMPEASYSDDIILVGIGSILNRLIPPAKHTIVFGSGAGYSPLPNIGSNWHIVSVRGPLSAQLLKLPREKAIVDSAFLIALLSEFTPLPQEKRHGIVFVPHQSALTAGDLQQACKLAGIEFLDPSTDSQSLIMRIRSAKLTIADAMHAAIISDLMRVPWVPTVSSPEISTFKWLDWTQSVGLPYEPFNLPSSTVLETVRRLALPACGFNFELRDKTPESALHDFAVRTFRERKYFQLRQFARRMSWYQFSGSKRALHSFPLCYYRARSDKRRLQRTAEILHRLTKMNGMLSDEATFSRRVSQTAEALELLKCLLVRFSN